MDDTQEQLAAGVTGGAGRERRWRRDRGAKEQALLLAFDAVMRGEGVQDIGVNAVIKEAGVGKNLLYSYFGSLAGLAKAWADDNDILPSEAEVTGGEAGGGDSLVEAIAGNYGRYAAALRRRPQTLEILAAELVRPNEVTTALRDARKDLGRRLHSYFPRSLDTEDDEVIAVLVFVYAAINYMALRSVHTPQYFFLDLSTDEGWERVDRMLRLIVSRVLGDGPVAPPDTP